MAANNVAILWQDAMKRYTDISGKDLGELPPPKTTGELQSKIEKQNQDFKNFREKSSTLFTILSAALKPIELFGDLAAGAASTVFPPSSICFGAAMYLINAARGVSAFLDAIAELLSVLGDITSRLTVYHREDVSQELREKLTEILTTVIEIFARSTKVIQDGVKNRLKLFGKNLLLGNDTTMQNLMGKLEKLTTSEGQLVGAETLAETKRTGKNVEAVQQTMTNNTAQLEQISIVQYDTFQGVDQILSVLKDNKIQAMKASDSNYMDDVEERLKRSVAPQVQFNEIRRKRTDHTGDWICSERAFKSWSGSAAPILWVSGIPGTGKSYLAYNMIEHLRDQFAAEQGTAGRTSIGYTFFKNDQDQTRSLDQALRDIAWQLAETDQLYAKHVCKRVHSNTDVSTIGSAWQALFVDFFLSVSEQNDSSAFIILDGLDEAFVEERKTFFELLVDVEEAGPGSRLRVAMLGRPEIMDEIAYRLNNEHLNRIDVSAEKNREDIARYVKTSIAKSRTLKRLSRNSKAEIVQIMTAKADGMFMWAKLMLDVILPKSKLSAVKHALQKAPMGLAKMLQHVLASFSASIQDPQDASDLNDLLMWVTLAKRPLSLGELDSVLRMKSAEGEGVLNLEGKLRIQFASFFVLTRRDGLTTADLQDLRITSDACTHHDTQAGTGFIDDDGSDEAENDTEFNSDPSTTRVSFVHASISDFFRDTKQGKVSAGEDLPAVGVALQEAALAITKACLDVLVDDSLPWEQILSLRPYASKWLHHLVELECSQVDIDNRLHIGPAVASLLQRKNLIERWYRPKEYIWFDASHKTATSILAWLLDSEVMARLSDDTTAWVRSCEANPVEIFEPAVRFCAMGWLKKPHTPDQAWYHGAAWDIVWAYMRRKDGAVVDKVPKMSAEQIIEAANWAGFEQTAKWHRLLGTTLSEEKHYDAALKQFQQAISLDSQCWLAKVGMAEVYSAQDMLEEAVRIYEDVLEHAAIDNEKARDRNRWQTELIHNALAKCFVGLAGKINTPATDADLMEVVRYNQLAITQYKRASRWKNALCANVAKCIGRLHFLANTGLHVSTTLDSKLPANKTSDSLWELQPPTVYQEQIMDLLHDMSKTQKDKTHTALTDLLHQYPQPRGRLFMSVAQAAYATGELEWLQEKYKEAIRSPTRHRWPVDFGCLQLCPPQLYFVYGGEPDKAAKLWEQIGTQRSGSEEWPWFRQMALDSLGVSCLSTALRDETQAEHFISRMEHIILQMRVPCLQMRPGTHTLDQAILPSSNMVEHLAFWYRKHGRTDEARQLIRPHVNNVVLILSDDGSASDGDGLYRVSKAFLAISDTENFLASMYAHRRYDDAGFAAVEVDQQIQGDSVGVCEGTCWQQVVTWDRMVFCLLCGDICESRGCYKKLLAGQIPGKSCAENHDVIHVPALKTRFRRGETVVGDKVVTLQEWKAALRTQYNL